MLISPEMLTCSAFNFRRSNSVSVKLICCSILSSSGTSRTKSRHHIICLHTSRGLKALSGHVHEGNNDTLVL